MSTAIDIPRDRFIGEADEHPDIVALYERADDAAVAAKEAREHVEAVRALKVDAIDHEALRAWKRERESAEDEADVTANVALAARVRAEQARDKLASELREANAIESAKATLAYQCQALEVLDLHEQAVAAEKKLRELHDAVWRLAGKGPAPVSSWLESEMRMTRIRMLELKGATPRTREEIATHLAAALHVDVRDLLATDC